MPQTWRSGLVVDVYKLILWLSFASAFVLTSLAPPNASIQPEIQSYLDEQTYVVKHILKDYDKRFIPAQPGKPLDVTLQVIIADIIRIDNMELEMIVYIKQKWRDHRLSWNSTKKLKIREHFLDKIWLPDVRIINLKAAKRFEGFGGVNMNIQPNGRIYYSKIVLITTSCPMNLHSFPLDRQTCFLKFSSFAYSKKLLNFTTHGKHVVIKHNKLPQFDLVETNEIEGVGKKVPGLTISLTFQRRFGYYLMSIYIPSACIVLLSWLSFFMEPSNIADRLALEITMTLTTVFLLGGINESIAHVSYAKASDIFVIVCFGFIFFALLETMLVYRLSVVCEIKEENRWQCCCDLSVCYKAVPSNDQSEALQADTEKPLKDDPAELKCCSINWATCIDKICVVLFPTVFLTFNIVYWKYYTSINK